MVLIIFILYNIIFYILNDYTIPVSISETSYISKRRLNTPIPFTLFCIASSIGLFFPWITKSPENYQFLVFISCFSLIIVGVTPYFKEEYEGRIHYACGIVAFICGILWLILTSNWTVLILIFLLGGIWTLINRKCYVFAFEFVSYILINLICIIK